MLSQGNVEDSDDVTTSEQQQDDAIDGIFVNNKIQRRLDVEMVNEIFKEMVKNSDAFYTTKKDQTSIFINFYRPEDWGSMILEWVSLYL